ncbi:MAG: hypothetical protein HeimC2_17900 [Candidatus Heimdallarchaeota archaeon LC_2]|nr:MAG: hypothetical protein HeimC2_17900 [Candidatus Heimdallarchaeota archaeon LC_2]
MHFRDTYNQFTNSIHVVVLEKDRDHFEIRAKLDRIKWVYQGFLSLEINIFYIREKLAEINLIELKGVIFYLIPISSKDYPYLNQFKDLLWIINTGTNCVNDQPVIQTQRYTYINNQNQKKNYIVDYKTKFLPLKEFDKKIVITPADECVVGRYENIIFMGIDDFFGIHSGGYLERENAEFFLTLYERILLESDFKYISIQYPKWMINIRIDDVPSTIWIDKLKLKILEKENYRHLVTVGEQYGNKFDLMYTPYYLSRLGKNKKSSDIFPEIIQVLKEGISKTIFQVGNHGFNHSSVSTKLWNIFFYPLFIKFKSNYSMYQKEFFDVVKNRELSDDEIKRRIFESNEEIEKIFGVKPLVFTPPTHTWTNKVNKNFLSMFSSMILSCDSQAMESLNPNHPKTMSLIGLEYENEEETGNFIFGSGTQYGSIEDIKHSTPGLHKFNLPLIWVTHVYDKFWFGSDELLNFNKVIQQYPNHEFLFISEIVDRLKMKKSVKLKQKLDGMNIINHTKYDYQIVLYDSKKESSVLIPKNSSKIYKL